MVPVDVGLGFSYANSPASGASATVENNANIVFNSPGATFEPQSLTGGAVTTSADATAAASGKGSAVTPGASAGIPATSSGGGMFVILGLIAVAGGVGLWFALKKHKKG